MSTPLIVIELLNQGKIEQAEAAAKNITNTSERQKVSKLVKSTKSTMSKAKTAAQKAIGAVKDTAMIFDASNKALMQQNLSLAANIDQLEKLNQQTISLQLANVTLMASFSELNKGMLALEGTMGARLSPGFDKMRKQLGQQVLTWSRFGVGIEDSAEYMNEFNTTLGMSPKQIGVLGRQLQSFAAGTGQSFNKVLHDYNANLNQFAGILDSGEMTRQMMLLGASSKRMGMNLTEAMGPLQKFETMAGAQQAGAKLNQTISALGGTFDSVKASMMDYPERMDYIAQTVQSVMPRIRAAGPRAQRLYMRSLSQSLGMNASQIRKLANFEVGGGRAFERQLAQGVLPQAMSAGMERQLARGMLNAGDIGSNLERLAIETTQAGSLRALGAAGMSPTTFTPRALELFGPSMKAGDDLEKFAIMGGKALESFLDKSGLKKQLDDLVTRIENFNKGISTKTKQNTKAITKMAHSPVGGGRQ